jgi:hypothetical protein
MTYVRLLGKTVLALAFALGLLIATADDHEIVSLDPAHPATLLPLVTSRLRAVQSYVRDVWASDFLATVTAGFHKRTRHENTTPSPSQ